MPAEGDPEKDENGEKRKRATGARDTRTEKRRKIETLSRHPTVLWMPITEALGLEEDGPIQTNSPVAYALLGDWRERLKDANGLMTATFTGDGPEVELPDLEENAEEWEEMSESDGDESMEEGIDPELIKSALAAKLSGAGLAGTDQAAFMQTLMQMLSGEGGGSTDDMIKGLTKTLLDQAVEDGPGSAFSQFLSQQGVSLDNGVEDEGDEEEEANGEDASVQLPPTEASLETSENVVTAKSATPKKPTPKKALQSPKAGAGTKRKKVSFAPSEEPVESESGDASEPTLPDSKRPKRDAKATAPTKTPKNEKAHEKNGLVEVEPKQNRKRKADTDSEILTEKPKRQARNFAAPTASSKNKVAETAPKAAGNKSKAADPAVKTTRSGKQRK